MADGMTENVAGLLCYSLGWITGLIFLLIDKRPFVRFHAAQSIVIFGGLHILYYILVSIFLVGIGAVAGGFGLAFVATGRGQIACLGVVDCFDGEVLPGRAIQVAVCGGDRRKDCRAKT